MTSRAVVMCGFVRGSLGIVSCRRPRPFPAQACAAFSLKFMDGPKCSAADDRYPPDPIRQWVLNFPFPAYYAFCWLNHPQPNCLVTRKLLNLSAFTPQTHPNQKASLHHHTSPKPSEILSNTLKPARTKSQMSYLHVSQMVSMQGR